MKPLENLIVERLVVLQTIHNLEHWSQNTEVHWIPKRFQDHSRHSQAHCVGHGLLVPPRANIGSQEVMGTTYVGPKGLNGPKFGLHPAESVTFLRAFFSLFVRWHARPDMGETRIIMVWLDYETNDNLSTNCVQFVLVLSSFCPKFVTTKKQYLSFVKFWTKTKQK